MENFSKISKASDMVGEISSNWILQFQGVKNAFKTGHCAPTVMRTLRESQGAAVEPMVKLTSGMDGELRNFSIISGKNEFFRSFVIPAPKRIRDKLQQEFRLISCYY